MARRGWGVSITAALGVAAGTGAAQLGFGYGLGIINWTPAGAAQVEATWVASLAWATWISATSVVAGAICAHRLRGGDAQEPGGPLRKLGLAVGATAGALITVLLVAVPARAARVPDTSAPQTVAAGYAAVGLLIGLLLAMWALHTRAVATNLVATTGWLWLLAVVSVVDGVLSGRGLTTAQLGIWQISADSERFWIRDYFYWPGALLALGSALVIGVLAARRTARVPEQRVGTAASGAAGPLLVALAYLLAVPRLAAIAAEQLSAHLIAPYAVIAGVGGSVLVAALAQRAEHRVAARTGVSLPRQRTGEHDLVSAEADGPAVDGATGDGRPTVDVAAIGGSDTTVAGGSSDPAVTGSDGKPVRGAKNASSSGSATARRGRAAPPRRASGSSDGASAPADAGPPAVPSSGSTADARTASRPATTGPAATSRASGGPATDAPAGTTATGDPGDGGPAPKGRRGR
ncbi:hypothetical protein [Micromonospora narathiwatensis]|uniref:Uncharacterized protein n=1 Tax=Micromonospora narathiwatensis TaxID=299146 RepID=A0A1A9AAE3_9ACTN|nr:hypothetical protein [Micromonospora narathiwatensis]SBT53452.1 hypothetical protein GA0070621_4802 [Micromonospora narathiwatensis]